MKPIGLHASDLHLRSRRGDEQFAFKQIVDAALRHKVRYVCLAGDNLDKQSNRAETIAFLRTQFDRLADADVAVLFIQGQHDFDDPPWLSAFPGTCHLHRTAKTFDGIGLYGIDWQPHGRLQEELAEVPPESQFLVCHQVWADWMGEIACPQGSFAQVPGHVQFLHSGDLHQWKLEQRKNADGAKMTVLSTGATCQQKVDEPEEHYYGLVFSNGTIERKKLKSRVFVRPSVITMSNDLDALMGNVEDILTAARQKAADLDLPQDMLRPVMRVTYAASVSDTVRRVEKVVGDRAILSFRELVPEEKTAAYAKAKASQSGEAVTPLSALKDELSKDDEPEAYALCELLLSATDKDKAFAAWRAEFLGEVTKPQPEE